MGSAQSGNYVRESIYQAAQISNKAMLDCTDEVIGNQSIEIDGCSNVKISNVNMKQVFALDKQCAENASSSSSVDQAIKTALKQASESIVKDYGIGSAESTNNADIFESVTVDIANDFRQNCGVEAILNQTISCKGGADNIIYDNITMEQQLEQKVNCTMNAVMDNKAVQDITNDIDQKASATVSGINWAAVLIVLILVMFSGVGATGYVLTKQASVMTDPKKFLGEIILFGTIFSTVHHFNAWYIFKPVVDAGKMLINIFIAFGKLITKALNAMSKINF
jgi:hypothetical protein